MFHKPDQIPDQEVEDNNDLDNPYYDYLQSLKRKPEKNLQKTNKKILKKAQKLNLKVIDTKTNNKDN